MLITALENIKEMVFSNTIREDNFDNAIESIANKNGLKIEDLAVFYNLFADLKRTTDEQNITVRRNKDWLDQEVEILMAYMNWRESTKEIGGQLALQKVAQLLGKGKGGVQSKYYAEKKTAESNGKIEKVAKKRSKKHVVAQDFEQPVQQTTKEGPSFIPFEETSIGFVEQKKDATTLIQENGQTVVKTNTLMKTQEDVLEQTESKSLTQMLSGLINNITVLEQGVEVGSDTIRNLIGGLYQLSSVAANNSANNAETKTKLLELEFLKTDVAEMKKAYKELEEKHQLLQNTVSAWLSLNDVEQLTQLEDFNKRFAFQLDKKTFSYKVDKYQHVVAISN